MDLYISDEHLEALYEDFGRGEKNHIVLIEEMAELTKALTKRLRYGDTLPIHTSLIEEMAHVYICLEAIAKLEGVTEDELQMEIYMKEKENV